MHIYYHIYAYIGFISAIKKIHISRTLITIIIFFKAASKCAFINILDLTSSMQKNTSSTVETISTHTHQNLNENPMSLAFTLWLTSPRDCQPSCYTKRCVALISDSHSIITLSELPHKTLQHRHPAFITPSPPSGHMERLSLDWQVAWGLTEAWQYSPRALFMSYCAAASTTGLHTTQNRPLHCVWFTAPLDGILFDNCLLAMFRLAVNTPLPVFLSE